MSDKGTTTIIQDKDIQADVNSFVQAIIVEYQLRHGVTILSHSLEPETTAEVGRYFSSYVFRLTMAFEMSGEKCCSSVIVKVPHLSPVYPKLKKLGLYQTEEYMYNTFLSRVHQLWPGESLSPLYYGASPSGLLALENLQERGFRMLPRNALMDLTQCKLVLKRLAQFHALSAKYFELYGSEDISKLTSFQHSETFSLAPLFHKTKTYVIPTLSPTLRNKWAYFEENFYSVMIDAYTSHSAAGFTVLLHGDMHANNLLVKDGGECKFIDFQMCRQGSPILDLTYFLASSVKWEVIERHRDEVLNHYVDTLEEVLKVLDCSDKTYNRNDLDADFEKYKLYVIFVVLAIVPLLRSGIPSLEGLNEDEQNKMDNVIQSADYISLFKNWLELV